MRTARWRWTTSRSGRSGENDWDFGRKRGRKVHPVLNLNGVLTPAGGEVRVDGVPVTYDRKGLISVRKQVGIVFQDPDDQLFSADVYRDISFGGVNLGLPEEEVRRRVDEAMEWTGVTHLKGKPTHALVLWAKKSEWPSPGCW